MRKIREEIEWKEERFTLLADKAELQGLQAGEERRGGNASQALDCCLETMVEQVFAMGTDLAKSTVGALCKIFVRKFETSISPAQMQGRDGRRDSENEPEQGRASQQLVSPTPSEVNQDAPVSSLELDLHRVRGVPGESGSAVSKQGD